MAEFKPALECLLCAEGSEYVDDPADSGGATKWGISLRFLRSLPEERLKRYGIFGQPSAGDVQELTRQQVELIYEWEFWMTAPFEEIGDQDVCNYIFSMCVLHGTCQGVKIVQRAIWAVMAKSGYLADDGIMGKATLAAVNSVHEARLLTAIMAENAGFCRMIAAIRKKDERFLHGWLERCYKI